MQEKTVYKIDSKGKNRFVTISTEGSKIYQISGIVGTDNPVTNVSECVGKNIGKVNETTPEQQAALEAQAKLKKKLEEGYYESIEEADQGELILPMLAHSFDKHEKKVKYPCLVSRKLDGNRMLAIKKNGIVKLFSRQGKEITTLNHIKEQLENPSIPDNIYDGEAYNMEIGSFQEQIKAIKKDSVNTMKINFNIYDIIIDKPYNERLKILKNIFG